MNLLIIGHTAHYYSEGKIFGWGPTVNEVNALAKYFGSITHLACIKDEPKPLSALPYVRENVHTILVPPAGGFTFREKISIITLGPKYIISIIKALSKADIVQIRAPGGIALYAVLLSPFIKKPLWIKYGGNWFEEGRLHLLRTFIRWWLKTRIVQNPITVNGKWPNQRSNVYTFYNPSFSFQDIENLRIKSLKKHINSPVRFLFAGRLEIEKGADILIDIFYSIQLNIKSCLDILGEGPLINEMQQKCIDLSIMNDVTFHGWRSQDRVKKLLESTHFLLLPSMSEGWPKILSEGMAYGAVPLASTVSSIPQIFKEMKAGYAIPLNEISEYQRIVLDLVNNENKWKQMSRAGIKAAKFFTFEYYIISLDKMFLDSYGFSPFDKEQIDYLHNDILEKANL